MQPMTPDLLLRAYALGVFPMARSRDDERLCWVDPDMRGILPLDRFHVPRSLAKLLKREPFTIRVDTAFEAVLEGCAEPTPKRPDTWINPEIHCLFVALHRHGLAHSVECWREDRLVGGIYGLALGGAFFGESMFSRQTGASKIALCHLVALMRQSGFRLLDTQFITDHLKQFGAVEIPREDYRRLLAEALEQKTLFQRDLAGTAWDALRQPVTQIS